jgi:Iron-dependent Transcriptional regulator
MRTRIARQIAAWNPTRPSHNDAACPKAHRFTYFCACPKANNIPKKFLDQILADLRRVGLVHSKKGKAGGYALAKPASEILVFRH